MEKMLVVIFDNEAKAHGGSHALAELDREGSVSIHAEAMVQKNNDGSVRVDVERPEASGFPVGEFSGTAIGSLIGLLGGPIGFGVGAALGMAAGAIGDFYVAGVNQDFVADVSAALTRGKFALIADVSEECVTPVDTKMEAIGGVVFRTAKQHFEEERRARDVAALRAEIEHLKAEQALVRTDRKANIQAKIVALNRKLQHKIEHAKRRSEQLKRETDAKVQALQNKAAAAPDETKVALHNRITEIRKEYKQRAATLQSATGNHLGKQAHKLEKKPGSARKLRGSVHRGSKRAGRIAVA
jgi:uncharacterized membrane protein